MADSKERKNQDGTKPGNATTIHDVARAAGVAIGTASKALNGRGQLREETRMRVREAADRLGFSPNDLAHSLHRGRTFTVGLITTDSYGRFSIPVLTGIEDALQDANISVFLCNTLDDPERERLHIRSLLSKRVDGFIVTAWRTDPRPALSIVQGTPVVYAYAQADDPNACCFLPDDTHGGRLAAEHLLDLGRRRLAHITGPGHFQAVQQRRDAMLQVLDEWSIPMTTDLIVYGPWSENWGYEAARQLLETDPSIDGIFCGSDEIARGVLDAAREQKLNVPNDVSIVGFDNWEVICRGARPPLTTVDMNLHELGKVAGQTLVTIIGGQAITGTTRLPCSLVIRHSSIFDG